MAIATLGVQCHQFAFSGHLAPAASLCARGPLRPLANVAVLPCGAWRVAGNRLYQHAVAGAATVAGCLDDGTSSVPLGFQYVAVRPRGPPAQLAVFLRALTSVARLGFLGGTRTERATWIPLCCNVPHPGKPSLATADAAPRPRVPQRPEASSGHLTGACLGLDHRPMAGVPIWPCRLQNGPCAHGLVLASNAVAPAVPV
mmetsp:Transcript_87555/g.157815  ORF Transcript_87555/g.157815 Transcript_87555/m.157815 type:complete len:200 (-) Transcript_87555:447-1046(-)